MNPWDGLPGQVASNRPLCPHTTSVWGHWSCLRKGFTRGWPSVTVCWKKGVKIIINYTCINYAVPSQHTASRLRNVSVCNEAFRFILLPPRVCVCFFFIHRCPLSVFAYQISRPLHANAGRRLLVCAKNPSFAPSRPSVIMQDTSFAWMSLIFHQFPGMCSVARGKSR